MKVYIVVVNNGETYDDYEEWIDSVYRTREDAEKRVIQWGIEYHNTLVLDEELYQIEEWEVE